MAVSSCSHIETGTAGPLRRENGTTKTTRNRESFICLFRSRRAFGYKHKRNDALNNGNSILCGRKRGNKVNGGAMCVAEEIELCKGCPK